ncbi:crotonase/enoyl-CoA hydratase family protein [Parafrankia sp. EUN1f]|uniref:crotonase/enoyl-CoA hydratase family protein n=1 Tax=Parafrankia sp. EUN1f TaxID=102897 RepID=UPI0001C45A60|nr:crotonase/enoyl-CoA hydratase family protein [Parafrankia sp. EUN1f]EFC82817.1 Enoyl-CoA hydratase/isomerase [Parafrankia sp. EUN1f]
MADEALVDVDGNVMVITLNRPAVRNAFNRAASQAAADAFREFDARPDLRVAVLTGAGGTFSSGQDLRAFADGEVAEVEGGLAGITGAPPRKPVIAAVEGYALAGGFEVALACDLITAASDAVFGLPEVRRGLVSGAGGLLRLARRIPYHTAMRLALTGATLPAPQAYEYGLVSTLTEPGEALAAALDLAAEIAANAPLAVIGSKEVVAGSAQWSADEAWQRQRKIMKQAARSADAREGAIAFTEKRPPIWRGE